MMVEIERQGDEDGPLEGGVAVSSLTLYNCTGELPIEFLKQRISEILQANPWLASVWRGKKLLYPKEINAEHCSQIINLHFCEVSICLGKLRITCMFLNAYITNCTITNSNSSLQRKF